ncbi:MAG: phosphopyruvate hydratase [Nanoarchaeota archaeon]|nr:phosphopyruvate hydratase [Nanoarchaeota archaeon]
MDTTIQWIKAREVLDSRGNPTVEVELSTPSMLTRAIVPSGASTGSREALEMRDKDERYGGKGVKNAVRNVNEEIAEAVKGMDCKEQHAIDNAMLELDGTENKSRLGANAMLAVSMAACKAGAYGQGKKIYEHIAKLSSSGGITLPVPMMNVINGGRHAGKENDIQEHMLVVTGAKNFTEALRMGTESYHALKKILISHFGPAGELIGDEGGFVPQVDIHDRLEFMMDAIEHAGYDGKIKIGLDAASSEFFKDGTYAIGDKTFSSGELIDFYKELASTFPIISMEDGMAEDDWEGWAQMVSELGGKMQLVADDLTVSNTVFIKKALEMKAANALLLKVNQIGTVTEAIRAGKLAKANGWGLVVSHRSGESEDSFIADLVVGMDAGQSKFGAPARSDRNAKYNQLLRIEEELGDRAMMAKPFSESDECMDGD